MPLEGTLHPSYEKPNEVPVAYVQTTISDRFKCINCAKNQHPLNFKVYGIKGVSFVT